MDAPQQQPQQPAPIREVAIVFNGAINTPMTTKLRNAMCAALNGGYMGQANLPCKKLWLLMNSGGGSIEDGFALYNLLRSFNCDVVTVNMGQIASIANIVL